MAGKEDIVTKIAHKSGLTKKATYKFLKALGEVLTETLVNGERFHIHKVLTLSPEYKEECTRHNPRTQEKVVIPPHIKVRTIIGTELQRALDVMEGTQKD